MTDIVDAATRSRMMSGIRGRNTNPERTVRSLLHRAGFRFRLDGRKLPGRPDLVFPGQRVAVFVHGCFWHRHGCHLTSNPSTRHEFWEAKFTQNLLRDARVSDELLGQGWRVCTIWECALKGRHRWTDEAVTATFSRWYRARTSDALEIPPTPCPPDDKARSPTTSSG